MLKKACLLVLFVSIVFSCNNDDDIIPVCDIVTNISSNSITNNSAIITWETISTSATYTIEYGISGFTLGSGTTVSESDTDAELNNLESNTTYDVYIQTVCDTNNLSMQTDVYSFTTLLLDVATEFKPILSEMNLFIGNLEDLLITPLAFEYNLSTSLFSDYAHKQRIIALPSGTSMEFDGDGLPLFPDNTVIAKTFYYNIDERNVSLGRQIVETRILIKINGSWETGDYKWIDASGTSNSITYKIPSNTDCFTCHHNNDDIRPIGPKLRSMNFEIDGVNQLEQFISNQQLSGVASSTSVRSLPNWEDTSLPLDVRARAYMDINCAHCHIPGGQCEEESTLNFAFETPLEESNIANQTFLIDYRINADVDGVRMPFIGTTILHTEGVQLIQDYIDTLD